MTRLPMSKNELLSHRGTVFVIDERRNIVKITVDSSFDVGPWVYVCPKDGPGYHSDRNRFFKNYWDARRWLGKYMS